MNISLSLSHTNPHFSTLRYLLIYIYEYEFQQNREEEEGEECRSPSFKISTITNNNNNHHHFWLCVCVCVVLILLYYNYYFFFFFFSVASSLFLNHIYIEILRKRQDTYICIYTHHVCVCIGFLFFVKTFFVFPPSIEHVVV